MEGSGQINKIGSSDHFRNRVLLIATMHGKEKVMAPVLESALEIATCVANRFDTDQLGTFTGEIERKDDPLTTLRNKCMLAMESHGSDLVVGNEGSFGPHPGIFFVNADDELVMLIDKKNGLEIVARELSTETNFSGMEVETENQLLEFARKAGFPSHGLILRNEKGGNQFIVKGITNEEHLLYSFRDICGMTGNAYVETDMRAMFNPTRMKVIRKATEKLIAKIKCVCPKCQTPGFDIERVVAGLPCSSCGQPTSSVLQHIHTCKHCNYSQPKINPNGKANEDPRYCGYCNP